MVAITANKMRNCAISTFLILMGQHANVALGGVCTGREPDPLRVALTATKPLCYALCTMTSTCHVVLYKDRKEYDQADSNKYSGNCVLMKQNFNTMFSERWEEDVHGYKMCRTIHTRKSNLKSLEEPPFFCMSNFKYDITEAANQKGYNVEVSDARLSVTRFFKHVTGSIPFGQMAEYCAEENGVLPQPYDKNYLDELVAQANVQFPMRLGMFGNTNNKNPPVPQLYWMVPNTKDWQADLDASTPECNKFSEWDPATDYAGDVTSYMEDSVGKIKPGSFASPATQITCQFIGPNAAMGKRVHTYYDTDDYGAQSLLTDGDWNKDNADEANFRGVADPSTSSGDTWVAVDLGEPHVINTVMFKADITVYSAGSKDDLVIGCYVGESIPTTPVTLSSPDDYGLLECGIHKGWSTRVMTCTCKFLVGRYAVLIMGKRYDLAEIAVIGVPLQGATGQ